MLKVNLSEEDSKDLKVIEAIHFYLHDLNLYDVNFGNTEWLVVTNQDYTCLNGLDDEYLGTKILSEIQLIISGESKWLIKSEKIEISYEIANDTYELLLRLHNLDRSLDDLVKLNDAKKIKDRLNIILNVLPQFNKIWNYYRIDLGFKILN